MDKSINGDAVECLETRAFQRFYSWVCCADIKVRLPTKKRYVSCALDVRDSLAESHRRSYARTFASNSRFHCGIIDLGTLSFVSPPDSKYSSVAPTLFARALAVLPSNCLMITLSSSWSLSSLCTLKFFTKDFSAISSGAGESVLIWISTIPSGTMLPTHGISCLVQGLSPAGMKALLPCCCPLSTGGPQKICTSTPSLSRLDRHRSGRAGAYNRICLVRSDHKRI
jgi:hypothetical protein